VISNNSVTDGKPQPNSLYLLFRGEKGIKDLMLNLLWDSNARILDVNQYLIILSARSNKESASHWHGLLCVFEHIQHNLSHLVGRRHDFWNIRIKGGLDMNIRLLHLFFHHQ
jgi:hypothetical protein